MRMIRFLCALALATVFSYSANVHAGGYDTPILYSARHMGMGGVAISFVNDASALFHNPAGMARVGRGNLLLDGSMLLGRLTSPIASSPLGTTNAESELTFAPFFIMGGVGRITDWLVAGIAVYPVASAGGTYKYENVGGTSLEDSTSLFFLEISPGVAINLPGRVTLGLSWRVTMVSLERTQTPDGANPTLDLDLSGWSFGGFRAGIQQEVIEDHLTFGMSYRHRTETDVSADNGIAFMDTSVFPPVPNAIDDISSSFVLPSRIGVGVRGDFFRFGVGFDLEYTFQAQNEATVIAGTQRRDGTDAEFANIFEWQDGVTLRFGVEYSVDLGHGRSLPVRAGYVFENRVTNFSYPTAFGTPPGNTHVATLGVGYDHGNFQFNLAYAFRSCKGEVTAQQLANAEDTCVFCSYDGDYELSMHGLYLDFSYDWR